MAVTEADYCRHAGAWTANVQSRHRVFLANLQQRQQDKLLAQRRAELSRVGELELERGFKVCFNGANRTLGPSKPKQLDAGRPASADHRRGAARMLRVAGAVPVPVAARPATAAESPPATRRARRRWALNEPVLLRAMQLC